MIAANQNSEYYDIKLGEIEDGDGDAFTVAYKGAGKPFLLLDLDDGKQ